MEEKKTSWNDAEKLVSELIGDVRRHSQKWFIVFLVTFAALIWTNIYWIIKRKER